MSVRITLTDSELPPSEEFLSFIDSWLSGVELDGSSWAIYGQEKPQRIGQQRSMMASHQLRQRIAHDDDGMRYLGRAYELLVAMLIGDLEAIRAVQQKFQFILVVGAPRSGGKYLTKELFRALGYDPTRVPAVLAHDGFPEAGPWRFDQSGITWIKTLQTMAEYLTLVELFFAEVKYHKQPILIPKKATKAVYAPGFFQSILGASGEGVITIRHPVQACISTYEAAGGLPADHKFAQRGNIERLLARDLLSGGWSQGEVADMEYFDAYLRYWEDYYVRLAMGGGNLSKRYRIVAYGSDRLKQEARQNAERLGAITLEPEAFIVHDRRDRHRDWIHRSERVLQRVSEQWSRVGMVFPYQEIAECW